MQNRPNVLFILVDQLRAASLPAYGETQIETPHLDRLAREGVRFTNAISTSPVCTPYRSMLVTGRHPQTTGMLINFVRLRHDEIGVADAFERSGYRTGFVGKWHLHTGSFPQVGGEDFVPEGRDRLGFRYWRAYNFHMQYFKGWVNAGDWRNEQWEGFETNALARYAIEFMDGANGADDSRKTAGQPSEHEPALHDSGNEPFCLFVAPHQPHHTPFPELAPDEYYARLPERLELPRNVSPALREQALVMYRHYLAMTLAVDDMVGELLDYLDRTGLAKNTLVVFTSDHGTQAGAHEIAPWAKNVPYEESIWVPLLARLPGTLEGGRQCDALVAPVDFFPTLCGLCGVPVPRSVEGHDLSDAWLGREGAFEQDAVLTMNFPAAHNHLVDGREWRGVRTKTHSFSRWLDGREELFSLEDDRLQERDLAQDPAYRELQRTLEERLASLMAVRADALVPCSSYANWFDAQRRVVRNAYGPLGDPEDSPDWSLLA